MQSHFRFANFVLLSLTLSTAHAAALTPSDYPPALTFTKRPIDPLCFANLENNSDKIHLKNCGIEKTKYTITEKYKKLNQDKFYGFNWKDTSVDYPSGGASYYKAWDAGHNQYWIYTLNNTGGSGDFSAINLYARQSEDSATLQHIDGGDRCNGGIEDVTNKNHHLRYGVNLTAYDLFALANKNPHNLKAYDDLSACAVCCAAKAYYDIDVQAKLKLLYVDLGKNTNTAEMPMQGTHQACFNNLLAAYVVKGKNKLDHVQLAQFVDEFNKKCDGDNR